MTAKTQIFAPADYIRRVFGPQAKSLQSAGVRERVGERGKEYDVEHAAELCGHLFHEIKKRLDLEYDDSGGFTSGGEDLAAAKLRKTVAEADRLEIENDVTRGKLVRADEVEQAYMRRMRSACDVLDALPSAVKMRCPEISASALDAINQALIEHRNKAVGSDGNAPGG